MATKSVKAMEGAGKAPAKARTSEVGQSGANKASVISTKIKIKENGKFPLIRHCDITLPPRPEEGSESGLTFYNPRPLDEVLSPEKINKLILSIRLDGLMENPVVNFIFDPRGGGKPLIKVELLAGERRYHAIAAIINGNLPCVDDDAKKPKLFKQGDIINWTSRFGTVVKHEDGVVTATFEDGSTPPKLETVECPYVDVMPTRGGREIYEYIPCKVYNDLDFARKMRISFSENDNSEPLSVKAEVALVERLLKEGHKQQQVAFMLNSNITFVSQRSSFRTQLPPEAFDALMCGKMAANLAVNMLSFKPKDRDAYFKRTQEVARCDALNTIARHKAEKEKLEDEADEHQTKAKKAEKAGDTATAAKEKKRAATASSKAKKAAAREARAEAEKDHIKQGHAHKAQADLDLVPRTKKMLVKEQLDEKYIKGMTKYVTGDVADPVTGHYIPDVHASIVRRTAIAIRDGVLDPLQVIRDYMVESGEWDLPKTTKAGTPKGLPKDDEEEDELEDGADSFDDDDNDDIDEPDDSAFRYGDDDDDDDDDDDEEDDLDDDGPRGGRRRNEDDEDFEDRDWGNSDAFDKDWN